jgi:O-antigen/teichoic acid export membrane protein
LRLKNTLNNIAFGLGGTLITTLLGFISRTVFINTLGVTYLGVNGLMISVLSMLSLAELGVGTAITFSLYKPLAEKDTEKVNTLMAFYKKFYRIIGLIIFALGLLFMCFLKYIVKDADGISNLYLIYFIFLVDTSYTYFFSYKRTLITADQKAYLLVPFTAGFYSLMVVARIAVLILFQNYIIYLLIQLVVGLAENIFINRYINRKYTFLKDKSEQKIPKSEMAVITKNVKAMFLHRLGDYAVNGTDNIIISAFVSVTVVGLYSNYLLVITAVNTFLLLIFDSATASFGNLIAQETREKSLEVFKVFNFLGFWIFGWATVCFYNLLNPFISLWIGNSYLIEQAIINIVLLNYYLVGMRVPLGVVKTAAGVYAQDRYVPLIQAAVNLTFSIILVQYWGLAGVFAGTVISSVAVVCWYRPLVVYKHVFQTSVKQYFIHYFYYALVVVINILLTDYICSFFLAEYGIINFILRSIVCLIIPNLVVIALFFRAKEFKDIAGIVNFLAGEKSWGTR